MNHPLLQKASIVFSPTAYGTSTLNSIKPALSLGAEKVVNGNFATDSDWTKGTGWTISGGTANASATSNTFQQSSATLTGGRKYRVEFQITSYTSGTLNIDLGSSSYSASYTSAGLKTVDLEAGGFNRPRFYGGSVTCSIDNVSIKEITDADFDFTRNSIATRVNESGLIETVAANIPRIDYLSGVGVYLNEWQSTNTATYSNDFTQGDIFNSSGNPNAVNSVITATSTTSPDGTNNGWKLTDNNDSGTGTAQMAYYTTNVTSGDSNTFSIFLKKGSTDFAYITSGGFDSTENGTSYFNLSTGAISSAAANHKDVKMEDYGNGWYRCSISNRTTTDVIGSFIVAIATTSGSINITRDGSNFLYMFGVQAEANDDTDLDSFLTSYIPTSGGTVTRVKDIAVNSGNTDLINSPEGVLYINLAGNARIFASTRRISLSDGTNDNGVRFDFLNIEDRITMRVRVGGNNVAAKTITGTYNISQFHKYAIQWKENDFKFYIDGVEVGTSTSGATYPANTLDRLNFGSYAEGSNIEASIKCVAVFKQTLTDAELVTLTS
jgi:hypothetical protein